MRSRSPWKPGLAAAGDRARQPTRGQGEHGAECGGGAKETHGQALFYARTRCGGWPEDEAAALGLDGVKITVELEGDEPVAVVHATQTPDLSSTLDGYAFRWRHTGRSRDS
ncbi:hypothetical protein [Amycolatopsis sp. NPDC051128]|uniref:hypothetical protein n=1 Tax=Amycolatopsis sp. NPDC051128 TaxID=3155412 RepID=UPI00341BE9C9